MLLRVLLAHSLRKKINKIIEGGFMKGRMKVVILGLVLGVGVVGCSRDRDDRSKDSTTNRDTTVANTPSTTGAQRLA